MHILWRYTFRSGCARCATLSVCAAPIHTCELHTFELHTCLHTSVYIYPCVHIHMHASIRTADEIHTLLHTSMYIYPYMHIHMHASISTGDELHTLLHVSMYIYPCMHIHMHASISTADELDNGAAYTVATYVIYDLYVEYVMYVTSYVRSTHYKQASAEDERKHGRVILLVVVFIYPCISM